MFSMFLCDYVSTQVQASESINKCFAISTKYLLLALPCEFDSQCGCLTDLVSPCF